MGDDELDSVERIQFADRTIDVMSVPASSGFDLLAMDVPAQISVIYLGYYGRVGDPAGLDYWQGNVQDSIIGGDARGTVLKGVAEAFRNDAEGRASYPFLAATSGDSASTSEIAGFVGDVYGNLFNRAPNGTADDPNTGLGYWVDVIESRLDQGVQIGDVIVDIASGAQGSDADVLRHRIEVAESFAETLSEADYDVLADGKAKAREVVRDVDATDQSVQAAEAEIASLAGGASALTADVEIA